MLGLAFVGGVLCVVRDTRRLALLVVIPEGNLRLLQQGEPMG
jgi:hypothetical protein